MEERMRFRRQFGFRSAIVHRIASGSEVGPVPEKRQFERTPSRAVTPPFELELPRREVGSTTLFFRLKALTTHSSNVSY